MWLWFVRCVTLLCQSSYTPQEALEVRRIAIETVILAEVVFPDGGYNILWHRLMHLAEDIINQGPVIFD
jgi:hypothetical protein